MAPRTLSEKIWDAHVVHAAEAEPDLLFIDLHLVHEVTSPQAFDGLRLAGRTVRRPDLTVATADHNVPTTDIDKPVADPVSAQQLKVLDDNTAEFGITCYPMGDANQGIVHIIGPEQGWTQPGMTIVCGDSHTSTHGAFGALAFGIGTSEVEHVLATQTLPQVRPKTMAVTVEGELAPGVTAKDVALTVIGTIGTGGGMGHVIEYRGLGDRGPLHGGPHDAVQHVDRGRGTGRPGGAGRDDVRVREGPRPRAGGRGLGRRRRLLAHAAHRRGGDVRQGGRARRGGHHAARDLGHEPGTGGTHRGVGARPRGDDRRRRPRGGRAGAGLHGPRGRDPDPRDPRRHRLPGQLHELAHRGLPGRRRRARGPVGAPGPAGPGRARARTGSRRRPRPRAWTRSSPRPASSGASRAAPCAWP